MSGVLEGWSKWKDRSMGAKDASYPQNPPDLVHQLNEGQTAGRQIHDSGHMLEKIKRRDEIKALIVERYPFDREVGSSYVVRKPFPDVDTRGSFRSERVFWADSTPEVETRGVPRRGLHGTILFEVRLEFRHQWKVANGAENVVGYF